MIQCCFEALSQDNKWHIVLSQICWTNRTCHMTRTVGHCRTELLLWLWGIGEQTQIGLSDLKYSLRRGGHIARYRVMGPCKLVGGYRRFGETDCLRVERLKIKLMKVWDKGGTTNMAVNKNPAEPKARPQYQAKFQRGHMKQETQSVTNEQVIVRWSSN
jgi:hypothetical protein